MKALVWNAEAKLGEMYDEVEIPETHVDAARQARDELIETLAEADDEIMEIYLEGGVPTNEQIVPAVRRATLAAKLTPVFCGTAFKNKGVQPLLDAIVRYLPSPLDIDAIEGHKMGDESVVLTRQPSEDEPFSGLAFKIMSDPHLGKLHFVRVYSGVLESGSSVLNSVRDRRERVGKIYRMHANKREEISRVGAGDIVAVMGLKQTTTGETLCDEKNPIVLESMSFPAPVIAVASSRRPRPTSRSWAPRSSVWPRRTRPSRSARTRRRARPSSRAWVSSTWRSSLTGCGASSRSRPTWAARRWPTARRSRRPSRRSSTPTRSRRVAPASSVE
jgi:elongation factor G